MNRMRGTWQRKSPALWTYRLADAVRPYGYIGRFKDTEHGTPAWDATVTATRLDDDLTIAEGVSFDEARAALEQHAQQHADPVNTAAEKGADS